MTDEYTRRATAALRLFQRAITDDDQDSFELMTLVIEDERYFLCYSSDEGVAFGTMAEFLAEVQRENPSAFGDTDGAPHARAFASAAARDVPSWRMTPRERHAARLARTRGL